LRKILLSLSKSAPVYGKSVEASGRFLAVAFIDEQRADANEWAARKDAVLTAVAEQKKSQMIEAFIAYRRSQAKVEINPEALK
jgi:hypothetical protein